MQHAMHARRHLLPAFYVPSAPVTPNVNANSRPVHENRCRHVRRSYRHRQGQTAHYVLHHLLLLTGSRTPLVLETKLERGSESDTANHLPCDCARVQEEIIHGVELQG